MSRRKFGFIVEQMVTESTPLLEIEKGINHFFEEVKAPISYAGGYRG